MDGGREAVVAQVVMMAIMGSYALVWPLGNNCGHIHECSALLIL